MGKQMALVTMTGMYFLTIKIESVVLTYYMHTDIILKYRTIVKTRLLKECFDQVFGLFYDIAENTRDFSHERNRLRIGRGICHVNYPTIY